MSEDRGATEVLRSRLRSLAVRAHLGSLARELNVGIEALDSFWRDGGSLSNEVLARMARHFFDAEFRPPPVDRMIAPPPPPATPLCSPRPEFDLDRSRNYDPKTANYRGGRGGAAAPITEAGSWPHRRSGFAD